MKNVNLRACSQSQQRAALNSRCTIYDERFLTMGEKLGVSPHVLKKLVNHSVNDVTVQYLVLNIERLREHMPMDGFLKCLDVEDGEVLDCHLPG
jgi:hypothetical protein